MAQSRGEEVGTCRNDVAVLKIRGSLLQKIGFYFITSQNARKSRPRVGVAGRSKTAAARSNHAGTDVACK